MKNIIIKNDMTIIYEDKEIKNFKNIKDNTIDCINIFSPFYKEEEKDKAIEYINFLNNFFVEIKRTLKNEKNIFMIMP